MAIQGMRSALVAPLAALGATSVVAIAMAACAGLALCRHAGEGLDVCPIVVGLIVLAASLGLWALTSLVLEPHRAVVRHLLLRRLARMPAARTMAALSAVSALPIAAMAVTEADMAPSAGAGLILALLVATGSALATLGSILIARLALALGQRLVRGLVVPACQRRLARTPAVFLRLSTSWAAVLGDECVLAGGLGLRAPPMPVG